MAKTKQYTIYIGPYGSLRKHVFKMASLAVIHGCHSQTCGARLRNLDKSTTQFCQLVEFM